MAPPFLKVDKKLRYFYNFQLLTHHKPTRTLKMTEELIDTRMTMFNTYLDKGKLTHQQYQKDGVKWILSNELREHPICGVRGGFIADEMGLGKTIMMIGTMLLGLFSSLRSRRTKVGPSMTGIFNSVMMRSGA